MRQFALALSLVASPVALSAQAHEHTPGMSHDAPAAFPKEGGQAAFTTIGDHHARHLPGIANGSITAMHGHHD